MATFKQRDFVRVRLRPDCPIAAHHKPEEDGRYGRVAFHAARTDHQYSVIWRTLDDQAGDPIGKDVLGFYGDDELEHAQPSA
jgi:hypothetical protein